MCTHSSIPDLDIVSASPTFSQSLILDVTRGVFITYSAPSDLEYMVDENLNLRLGKERPIVDAALGVPHA